MLTVKTLQHIGHHYLWSASHWSFLRHQSRSPSLMRTQSAINSHPSRQDHNQRTVHLRYRRNMAWLSRLFQSHRVHASRLRLPWKGPDAFKGPSTQHANQPQRRVFAIQNDVQCSYCSTTGLQDVRSDVRLPTQSGFKSSGDRRVPSQLHYSQLCIFRRVWRRFWTHSDFRLTDRHPWGYQHPLICSNRSEHYQVFVIAWESRSRATRRRTHTDDHTLDVLITRSDVRVMTLIIEEPTLSGSDNLFITSELELWQENTPVVKVSECRRWRAFNENSFTNLVRSKLIVDPPSDVVSLVNCYDQTLKSLIDRHAPLAKIIFRSRPTASWYDATALTLKPTLVGSSGFIAHAVRHLCLMLGATSWSTNVNICKKDIENTGPTQ